MGTEFVLALSVMGAAIGIGLAAMGAAIGDGHAASKMLEGLARQPEMVKELMRATAKLAQYDTITAIAPLDKEAEVERGTARGKCLAACFSSIARQPEAYDDIVWAAEKFLGTTEIKSMSDKMLKYFRLYALEGVTEAVARQPEIVDLFDSFSVKFLGVGIK